MAYRICFSLILAMEYAITRTVMIIYIGEMSRKATNTRLMMDISQADKDLFDFLAMEIIGEAINATTTGRMPLKMRITMGLS